jgi:16S rRNA (adenine1518-N6/adenine1519-N6)-dimethyltransferase
MIRSQSTPKPACHSNLSIHARSRRVTLHENQQWTPSSLTIAGVRPSKARGQSFLVQPAIADRIVAAAKLEAGEEVIEIGPGLGILSERIAARRVRRLLLIELDSRLAERLRQRFADAPNVVVVESDFLHLDFASLEVSAPVKVIGNLPFNAASAIFRRLCEWRDMIGGMVLMFQREVAERIRAHPSGTFYSALSVYASMYWEIDSHFRVAAGSFYPKPKVDAEVLTFRPRRHRPFRDEEEAGLLRTIRTSFSAPRKTLRNALAGGLRISLAKAEHALAVAAIDPSARAATLSVEDFVRLARALRNA